MIHDIQRQVSPPHIEDRQKDAARKNGRDHMNPIPAKQMQQEKSQHGNQACQQCPSRYLGQVLIRIVPNEEFFGQSVRQPGWSQQPPGQPVYRAYARRVLTRW
jgi:hypothetical protein